MEILSTGLTTFPQGVPVTLLWGNPDRIGAIIGGDSRVPR